MTSEQPRRQTPAAQVLAPTARDIVVPVDRPSGPPPSEPAAPAPAPTPAEQVALTLPSPPPEAEDLHNRIMSLARTTERCARVLSALAKRVDGIEGKLSTSGAGQPAAPSAELALMSEQIGRLAAEVAETHQRVNERFGAVDVLQSEVGSLSSDLGGVHDKLTELARAQRAQRRTSPALDNAQRSLDELRRELAKVGARLVGLDRRLDELQSLPTVMEEVAANQFQRLVAEMLSVPEDMEGLYRELETITERMATREDLAARALERVASVEEAVSALRIDVDRVIGGLAAARQTEQEATEWRASLERRLGALESPGAEIERLYLALERLVGERAATDVEPRDRLPPGDSAPGERGANGAPATTGSSHSQRAVEALTAEVERIRRSIEVLVGPGARGPSSEMPHRLQQPPTVS